MNELIATAVTATGTVLAFTLFVFLYRFSQKLLMKNERIKNWTDSNVDLENLFKLLAGIVALFIIFISIIFVSVFIFILTDIFKL
jgi:hypothetical protein